MLLTKNKNPGQRMIFVLRVYWMFVDVVVDIDYCSMCMCVCCVYVCVSVQ